MAWYVFYLALAVAAFVAGIARLRVWTIVVGPVAAALIGIYEVSREPPNYDMSGFGYLLGGIGAALYVIAWLVGRAAASILDRK